MKKILIYPHYSNPYQTLLYQEFKDNQHIRLAYLSDSTERFDGYMLLLMLPLSIFKYRISGFTLFHLHWAMFTDKPRNTLEKILFFIYTFGLILYIKMLGYRLVWTVHNVLPHEPMTIHDSSITHLLCSVSDAKIVHSKSTIEQLRQLHCDISRIHIILHGNYISWYPNTVSQEDARSILGIEKAAVVFLCFGEIKPYKGIEDMLRVFRHCALQRKDLVLLIAGSLRDNAMSGQLEQYTRGISSQVKTMFRYIPDREVQYVMQAADVVVYPFRAITTSGSVLLALSFGKAIIYPALGSLKDIPGSVGFVYSAADKDGLQNAMVQACASDKKVLKTMGRHAYTYAASLSWKDIAQQTEAIYQQL